MKVEAPVHHVPGPGQAPASPGSSLGQILGQVAQPWPGPQAMSVWTDPLASGYQGYILFYNEK